jgi:hypothetical protein
MCTLRDPVLMNCCPSIYGREYIQKIAGMSAVIKSTIHVTFTWFILYMLRYTSAKIPTGQVCPFNEYTAYTGCINSILRLAK